MYAAIIKKLTSNLWIPFLAIQEFQQQFFLQIVFHSLLLDIFHWNKVYIACIIWSIVKNISWPRSPFNCKRLLGVITCFVIGKQRRLCFWIPIKIYRYFFLFCLQYKHNRNDCKSYLFNLFQHFYSYIGDL